MKEEIKAILDSDKCWDDVYVHGNKVDVEFSSYLAAIELERYFDEKMLEKLKSVDGPMDVSSDNIFWAIDELEKKLKYATKRNTESPL